jgi:tyrosyl-tRNA synthetase
MKLFQDLSQRGLIHQMSESEERPLPGLLDAAGQVVYAGFDPTGPSLHVGHLLPLLGLRRFQRAGHRVIALAGGATGLVGDPSGRSSERNLLDEDTLRANVAAIKGQLEKFLDLTPGSSGKLVDNLDWTGGVSLLAFLRDVGKHFTIQNMLRKDSVKNRIEREGEGLSYTEFSYMLLQAHDYLHLHRAEQCGLQIGGSDQWGNITCGIELIRRACGAHVHGMTLPLLLNSDGTKFGKSEGKAVWLDPARTSPFAFRQFWYNTADADVGQRLRFFSFRPLEELAALEAELAARPGDVKRALARELTALVHGEAEAAKVERAAETLFKGDLRELPAEYLQDAFEGAPLLELPAGRLDGAGLSLIDLLVETFHAEKPSKGAARRDLEQGSIALNKKKVTDLQRAVTRADLLHGRWLVLRKGKKSWHLVRAG